MSSDDSPGRGLCTFDSFTYNREVSECRATFDTGSNQPSLAVVGALSEVTETDPRQIPTLHHILDTEALDTLIESDKSKTVEVQFVIDEQEILIDNMGNLRIRPYSSD